MALTILIPALACWAVLAMGSPRKALLNVYLPALFLLPQYYQLRVQHLPPLNFAGAAVIPLGIALLMSDLRSWRWSWMDVAVFLLAVSEGLSEALSTELANGKWVNLFSTSSAGSVRLGINIANGGLMFVSGLLTIVLPYMIGKVMLEQVDTDGVPVRRKVIRRMVTLLAVVGAISVYDFVKGVSIWQKAFHFLVPYQTEIWTPQVRWGFGRIAGPFGHAILAGMIFLMGVIYCLWLRQVDPAWGRRRIVAGLPFTVRGCILTSVAGGLFMSQSRGPWVGVGLALIFVLFTRIFSAGKAALAFLAFVAIFGVGAYFVAEIYTNASLRTASTEAQRNAVYRRELLTSYTPIVEERPSFGWGITTYPTINGQQSIDNEYLLLMVTEGFFGLGIFLTILVGTGARLLQFMGRSLEPADRLLVFAHLSVLIGLVTAVTTVYMGEQVVALFFLFVGWVQGMQPARAGATAWRAVAAQPRFRRVLA